MRFLDKKLIAFLALIILGISFYAERYLEQPVHAHPSASFSFTQGDVFVGIAGGYIKHFRNNNGQYQELETLSTGVNGLTTGMCFDSAGNMLATTFNGRHISKFDPQGTLTTPWEQNFTFVYSPESCVSDSQNNIYVGEVPNASGTPVALHEFNSVGNNIFNYTNPRPLTTARGIDWIDLKDDCTLYYTSENLYILTYNLCSPAQGNTFNSVVPEESRCDALRILHTGEVLLACASHIYRFSADGTRIVTTYNPPPTETGRFYAMNLDPDGTTFWTATSDTGNVYHQAIVPAFGDQESLVLAFSLGSSNLLGGLAVYGEITAVQPTPTVTPTATNSPTRTSTPTNSPTRTPTSTATPIVCYTQTPPAAVAPEETTSYYIEKLPTPVSPSGFFFKAGMDAGIKANNIRPHQVLVVLDFSKPAATGSLNNPVWGTRLLNSHDFVTLSDIRQAAIYFAQGFAKGSTGSGASLILVVGTNNFQGDSVRELTPDEYRIHGAQWDNMLGEIESGIQNLRSIVSVEAGDDIEFDWGDSDHTLAWIEGFHDNGGVHVLYNYGSCDGCYPDCGPGCTLENNNILGGPDFTWARSDALYAVRGNGITLGLPEIYYPSPCLSDHTCLDSDPGISNADQALQWADLSLYSATHSVNGHNYGSIVFEGAFTGWRKSQSGKVVTSTTGWSNLWARLTSNSCTSQAILPWLTNVIYQTSSSFYP